MSDVVPMGTRRYCTTIAAPLSPRFKMRLERAVTQAIRNPTLSLPTLRRAVLSATVELRVQGLSDDEIQSMFTRLIEDVAREKSLDATSIVSGHPRWFDLTTRIGGWMQIAAGAE